MDYLVSPCRRKTPDGRTLTLWKKVPAISVRIVYPCFWDLHCDMPGNATVEDVFRLLCIDRQYAGGHECIIINDRRGKLDSCLLDYQENGSCLITLMRVAENV